MKSNHELKNCLTFIKFLFIEMRLRIGASALHKLNERTDIINIISVTPQKFYIFWIFQVVMKTSWDRHFISIGNSFHSHMYTDLSHHPFLC